MAADRKAKQQLFARQTSNFALLLNFPANLLFGFEKQQQMFIFAQIFN